MNSMSSGIDFGHRLLGLLGHQYFLCISFQPFLIFSLGIYFDALAVAYIDVVCTTFLKISTSK